MVRTNAGPIFNPYAKEAKAAKPQKWNNRWNQTAAKNDRKGRRNVNVQRDMHPDMNQVGGHFSFFNARLLSGDCGAPCFIFQNKTRYLKL